MNAELSKVSTIITNYNYELYLKDAIDSALNQTYPNTETIVVDDGSTDNSRELIASYGNKIISVYKENGGPASAFNAGFAVSQGEIVCLLDADDVWLPQKVEKVVEAFKTYSDTVVVYHKVKNIDKAGTLISPPWPPYKPIRGNISSLLTQIGGWWPFPPTSALGFSREFLSKVMNVPEQGEEYRVWVDAYLADLAPFFGEVVGIEPVLSHYRCHGANQWNNPASVSEDVQAMRVLHDYECRVNRLNHKLKHLGINKGVNLAEHWPYQVLKYQLGNKASLISLSLLALRNPWEHRLVSKLKTVALLWLQMRNFSRI
jgi:glycosyltransferase involved in cell wall biosynthesis